MAGWVPTTACVRVHTLGCFVKETSWKQTRQTGGAASASPPEPSKIERLGESGATHDSQSASRSGVEAWVARNLNGWDDSDAGLSQG